MEKTTDEEINSIIDILNNVGKVDKNQPILIIEDDNIYEIKQEQNDTNTLRQQKKL